MQKMGLIHVFIFSMFCLQNLLSQGLVGDKIYINKDSFYIPQVDGKIVSLYVNDIYDETNKLDSEKNYLFPSTVSIITHNDLKYTILKDKFYSISFFGGKSIVSISGNFVVINIDELKEENYLKEVVRESNTTFPSIDNMLNVDRKPIKELILFAQNEEDINIDFASKKDSLFFIAKIKNKLKVWSLKIDGSEKNGEPYARKEFFLEYELNNVEIGDFIAFSIKNDLYLFDDKMTFYRLNKYGLEQLDIVPSKVRRSNQSCSLIINKDTNQLFLLPKKYIRNMTSNFSALMSEGAIEVIIPKK